MKDLSGKPLPFLIKAVLIASCLLFSKTAFTQKESGVHIQPKTVIEMSIKELQRNYSSELSRVKFDMKQDGLDLLLKNVGNNVEAFFRNLANTSSREKVQFHSGSRSLDKEFNYLILPRKSGFPWTEDRTDKEGRPVNQIVPGYCISKGYAYTCIYLHPDHQKGSLFRYLGRASKEPRTHVIAFAQRPEAKDYLNGYINEGLNISIQFLVQGFIWLDPDSCQILRMKISMLFPNSALREQTTDIYFQKVRFDGSQQPFWLPKEVIIRWKLPNITHQNKHIYSDFHLFSVETDYKINQPQKIK